MGTLDPGATIALLDELFKGCGVAPSFPATQFLEGFPLPLDPNEFLSGDDNPGFSDLFASDVGDAGSGADGFDATMLDTIALIDLLDSSLTGALNFVEDAFGFTEGIDPASMQSVADAFATSVPVGNQIISDFGDVITPFPTPPPGGGGGGGGGGGVGAGGGGGGAPVGGGTGCGPEHQVDVYVDGIFAGVACLI